MTDGTAGLCMLHSLHLELKLNTATMSHNHTVTLICHCADTVRGQKETSPDLDRLQSR